MNTPLEECEARDVKGLYKKAREGKIKGMLLKIEKLVKSQKMKIIHHHQKLKEFVLKLKSFSAWKCFPRSKNL